LTLLLSRSLARAPWPVSAATDVATEVPLCFRGQARFRSCSPQSGGGIHASPPPGEPGAAGISHHPALSQSEDFPPPKRRFLLRPQAHSIAAPCSASRRWLAGRRACKRAAGSSTPPDSPAVPLVGRGPFAFSAASASDARVAATRCLPGAGSLPSRVPFRSSVVAPAEAFTSTPSLHGGAPHCAACASPAEAGSTSPALQKVPLPLQQPPPAEACARRSRVRGHSAPLPLALLRPRPAPRSLPLHEGPLRTTSSDQSRCRHPSLAGSPLKRSPLPEGRCASLSRTSADSPSAVPACAAPASDLSAYVTVASASSTSQRHRTRRRRAHFCCGTFARGLRPPARGWRGGSPLMARRSVSGLCPKSFGQPRLIGIPPLSGGSELPSALPPRGDAADC
jgi:hypothetical protein